MLDDTKELSDPQYFLNILLYVCKIPIILKLCLAVVWIWYVWLLQIYS